jgi:hypothetical protein
MKLKDVHLDQIAPEDHAKFYQLLWTVTIEGLSIIGSKCLDAAHKANVSLGAVPAEISAYSHDRAVYLTSMLVINDIIEILEAQRTPLSEALGESGAKFLDLLADARDKVQDALHQSTPTNKTTH